MSWAIKPKSFYAEQLKKLEDRAKEGKETSPKLIEKYYKGYLGRNGYVVNPTVDLAEPIKLKPAKRMPTKPCKNCGEPIEKALKDSFRTWEQIRFCSIKCKQLHRETMPNLSKSDKI